MQGTFEFLAVYFLWAREEEVTVVDRSAAGRVETTCGGREKERLVDPQTEGRNSICQKESSIGWTLAPAIIGSSQGEEHKRQR